MGLVHFQLKQSWFDEREKYQIVKAVSHLLPFNNSNNNKMNNNHAILFSIIRHSNIFFTMYYLLLRIFVASSGFLRALFLLNILHL